MEGVISVIVPVYNVAAYLPECLDSVLGQDYAALDVILIDDGSTDASGAICDAYAARDSRVRVIHQKNGGAAAAKNAGLRVAGGEYLSFVDSDDYLEPGAYAYMVDLLRQTGAEMGCFAFRNAYRDRTEDFVPYSGWRVLKGTDYLRLFATADWSCALLWNKLYRRELFQGVFFEEGHKIDDEFFTYQGVMNAGRVVCDERIVYTYRRRASSVMLSEKSRKQIALDRIDYTVKRRKTVISRFPELRREFDVQFLDAMIYLTEDPVATPESIRMAQRNLKDYLRQKGSTRPPRYFWKGLLKLYFTDAEKLAGRKMPEEPQTNVESYFL